MPRGFNSLHPLVRDFGYRNESEMLTDLYDKNGLSVRVLAGMLETTYSNVLYRLKKHGISLRARGGPNHVKEVVPPK